MRAIVVGTDGSPPARAGLRRAIEIAKGTGARLHVVTAFPDIPAHIEKIPGAATADPIDLRGVAETLLARVAAEVEDEGVEVETHDRPGDAADVLIDVAREVDADMIVVGARGLAGIERFLLGSVSSKLAHHAPTDVLIVRGRRDE
jgi:nucleotide-binding universal stress UspA family protein